MNVPTSADRPLLSPHAKLRWDPVRQQHQLVFPEGVLRLNDSSAAILRRCDGRRLEDLVQDLKRDYPDVNPTDVGSFVLEMRQRGLVHGAEPPA